MIVGFYCYCCYYYRCWYCSSGSPPRCCIYRNILFSVILNCNLYNVVAYRTCSIAFQLYTSFCFCCWFKFVVAFRIIFCLCVFVLHSIFIYVCCNCPNSVLNLASNHTFFECAHNINNYIQWYLMYFLYEYTYKYLYEKVENTKQHNNNIGKS